jgi:hypothetical protein
MSGTTIYGSTAVCSPVGKFSTCIDAGSGNFSGALGGTSATFSSTVASGDTLTINKAKAGSGVENLNALVLRLTGTGAIGDGTNIAFNNTNNTSVAFITGITGGDNVAYGSISFSTRNYNTDSIVEVMRINNRGNVGIGTVCPSYLLDVNGTGRFSSRILVGNSIFVGEVVSSYTLLESTSGNGIWLRPAGGSDPTGLKIATTGAATFSSSVTIEGSGSTIKSGNELRFNRADNAIYTKMFDAGSLAANGFVFDNMNAEGFHFKNNGTTIMRMNSAGNVGIGTSSPLQTSANRTVLTINGTSSAISNFGVSETLSGYIYADASSFGFYSQGDIYIDAAGSKSIILNTNSTERLRVTSEGYLGTTVTGTTVTDGDLLGILSFVSKDASTYSSGGITNIRSYATSTYNTGNVAGDLRFYVSNGLQNTTGTYLFGTEAMRIASTGNVGINQTSPCTQFQVRKNYWQFWTEKSHGSNVDLFSIGIPAFGAAIVQIAGSRYSPGADNYIGFTTVYIRTNNSGAVQAFSCDSGTYQPSYYISGNSVNFCSIHAGSGTNYTGISVSVQASGHNNGNEAAISVYTL